jgi:hypothetical protein
MQTGTVKGKPFRFIHDACGVMTQTLDLIRFARWRWWQKFSIHRGLRLHNTISYGNKR